MRLGVLELGSDTGHLLDVDAPTGSAALRRGVLVERPGRVRVP